MEQTFRKDVLDDIKWEKENINKQMELLQPMINALHKSRGAKLVSSSAYFISELIVWIGIIAAIAWLAFMFIIPPFFDLSNIIYDAKQTGKYTQQTLDTVEWSVRALLVLIIIFLFIIARQLAKLRNKNALSHVAGRTIADMQKKLQERIDKLNAFESKYDYIIHSDANIDIDGFVNPLPPPPDGDRLLE